MIIELKDPINRIMRCDVDSRDREYIQYVVIDRYQSIDVETVDNHSYPPKTRKPSIRITINSNLHYTIYCEDPISLVKSIIRDNKINVIIDEQ